MGRNRRQDGLAHAQGHRHGLADVQGLVKGQSAQAVRVEFMGRKKRLRTQERRLKEEREQVFSASVTGATNGFLHLSQHAEIA